MAKKKATPVKPARPSGVKTAPKKASVKTAKPARTSGGKAAPKKTTSPKKVSVKAKKEAVSKASPKKIKDANELLTETIVEGILEVKGRNISVLDLRDIHNRVCDYFIICQADSTTQVNAIADSIEVMVKKKLGEYPYRKEGFENAEWILVDYVTVVVHIFQSEVRNFYNLESLWADAHITEIAFDK